MARIFNKLAGAVTGFFSGLVSGFKIGARYYAHAWQDKASPFGSFFGTILGAIAGGFKFAMKGAAYGFKHETMKTDEYSKFVDQHYFGKIKNNEELKKYIHQLNQQSPSTTLLNNTELKQFEEYLKHEKDSNKRDKLQADYEAYQNYLQRVCPLTQKPVSLHHDPLEVEVYDPKTEETITRTYSRKHFIRLIDKNIMNDRITKEIDSGLPIFPEHITHVGFFGQIMNFIKTVRHTLNPLHTLLTSDPNLLREYGYEKIKQNSPKVISPVPSQPRTSLTEPASSTTDLNSLENSVKTPVNDEVQHEEPQVAEELQPASNSLRR